MNYFEKIPAKTEAISLSGNTVKIDTKGMEATVISRDADIFIKASRETVNEDAFVLVKGQSIALNGSFYISGDGADVRVLYCRII